MAHSPGKVALVIGQFNEFIVESLVRGARRSLANHGFAQQDIVEIRIPGAFEMPLALKKVAATKKYQGIVALGCVIRGGTPHFEFVAGECVKGMTQVALDYELPIGFGVLTVDSIEQAIERAGTKMGNKGSEAAEAVVEMIHLLDTL